MTTRRRFISCGLATGLFVTALLAGVCGRGAEQETWNWTRASPESVGLSSIKLDDLWNDLLTRKSTALIVIRDDTLVFERYGTGFSNSTPHGTASMAKALVGGMCTALALDDHRISLDDPASKYVSSWSADPMKSRITIRQLGSHTSGLADAEDSGIAHEKLTGWKGDFWKRLLPPNDSFTIARDLTPVLFEPGSRFQYSNPGIAMLSYVLTRSLADAPQKDLRSLLRERVMRPIGVSDKEWSVGYGQTVTVDGLPLVAPWGGGSYTPLAVARVGRLMLRNGDWNGGKILSSNAVHAVTTDAGTPGNCGIGWWSNNEGVVEALPRDAFWGSGAGHQVVMVVPSLSLIAVRNGENLNSATNYDVALRKHFFEPLAATLTTMATAQPSPSPVGPERVRVPPYPMSQFITNVRWASTNEIMRKANGSDNWPMTWADDDQLYTAYGDGNGFEPFVPQKLSLGLAIVSGTPPMFKGINLRSPTIERKGDGKKGLKASGILMVEGRLYLWLRNAANSRIAWSDDHGKTWTTNLWAFTKSFGCPTFLNFGRNYEGARDNFVYVYSHDSDNAYDTADRFVLARVPKESVLQQNQYEFVETLGPAGEPKWTRDSDKRGSVFNNPGGCYRSSISYNASLKRYLWCQTLPGGDARFSGGFGIYDAPQPWGPWTTVFYTDQWDIGPGETSSLPTKWMSTDGKTMHLVFSGGDNFCVRKLEFDLTANR